MAMVLCVGAVGSLAVVPEASAQEDVCPDGYESLPAAVDAETPLGPAELDGLDLSCADLGGQAIAGLDRLDSDLRGFSASGGTVSATRIDGADLTGADLRGATLVGLVAPFATVDDVDLSSASVQDSVFDEVDFTSAASLDGVQFVRTSLRNASLAGLDLTEAVLRVSDFTMADLSDTQLIDASLSQARLERTDLEGAVLDRAALDGARLWGALLEEASLVGADVRGAEFGAADLTGADLRRTDLRGADLQGATLDDVVWAGARCPDGERAGGDAATASCVDHLAPLRTVPETADDDETDIPLLPGAATGPPEVVAVLDQSTSMGLPSGGVGTRLDAAKQSVSQLLDVLVPRRTALGFVSYGGIDHECSVANSIGISPLDATSAGQIRSTVNGITIDPDDVPDSASTTGTSGTPTAAALEHAAGLFTTSGARTLVLVSDGESNCAGDPCDVARGLAAQGVAITVNTVGFQVQSNGREELQCIADATGGSYVDVSNSRQLADRLQLLTVATADWLALGDSYSSGEGAEDFRSTQPTANFCHRSLNNNWSAVSVDMVNRLQGTTWRRVDLSCSGAKTTNLEDPQTDGDERLNDPQLLGFDQLSPLGERIITFSLGGNDAGFGEVLAECVIHGLPDLPVANISTPSGSASVTLQDIARDKLNVPERPGDTCVDLDTYDGSDPDYPDVGRHTEDYIRDRLPRVLATAYDKIRQRWSETNQHWRDILGAQLDDTPATVYVVGYPQIFPDQDKSCSYVQPDDLDWIRARFTQANDVIEEAVEAADQRSTADPMPGDPIRFQFVDVENTLADHDLCAPADNEAHHFTDGSANGPWVNGIRKQDILDRVESKYFFHPNAWGHSRMAEVLTNAITGREEPSALPALPPPVYAVAIDGSASEEGDEPIELQAGQTIEIDSPGPFLPESTVVVSFASERRDLAVLDVDDQGALHGEVDIPEADSGSHELILVPEGVNGAEQPVIVALTIPDKAHVSSQDSTDDTIGVLVWLLIGALVLVLAGAIVAMVVVRRRRRRSEGIVITLR